MRNVLKIFLLLPVLFAGCASTNHAKNEKLSTVALKMQLELLKRNRELRKEVIKKQEANIEQRKTAARLLKKIMRLSSANIMTALGVNLSPTCRKNSQCILRHIQSLSKKTTAKKKSRTLLARVALILARSSAERRKQIKTP